jgi:hypothetical protein
LGGAALGLGLLMTAGCQDMQSADPPVAGPATGAKTDSIMQPTDKTIERLRGSDRWAVAVLHCEAATVSGEGTRSQAMTLKATIVETSDPKVLSPLNLEQYVTDDTLLNPGKTYLVILAGIGRNDDPVAWSIVQREISEEGKAPERVAAVKSVIEAGLK